MVAEIAHDHAAARDVRLVLPETGVCGVPATPSVVAVSDASVAMKGCCGGPAPADAKAAGLDGCGCGTTAVASAEPVAADGGCCG